MLFNSLIFTTIFLPFSVLILKILNLKSENYFYYLLIFISIIFYSFNEHSITFILLISILINFLFYKFKKKINYFFPIIINLAILIYYKYINNINEIFNNFLDISLINSYISLPLAISFFSIQQIIFHIDLNNSKFIKIDFFKYFFFIIFFPQLIAGPIMYFSEFSKQSKFLLKRFNDKFHYNFYVGFSIFTLGLFKKIIFADNLGEYVDSIYNNIQLNNFSVIDSWIFIFSYSAQIYFDFSAYSDMAIGIAKIFGLNLPVNFYSPYKSYTLSSFWKSWHITLSRIIHLVIFNNLFLIFLRNLKKTNSILILSIPVVLAMTISGLWHGSSLNFILWGFYHGFFLFFLSVTRLNNYIDNKPIGIILTFVIVSFSWVLFRSANLSIAQSIYMEIFNLKNYFEIFSENQTLFKAIQLHGMYDKVYFIILITISYIIIFFTPNLAQIYSLRYIDYFTLRFNRHKSIKKIIKNYLPYLIGIIFSISLFIIYINSYEREFIYFRF